MSPSPQKKMAGACVAVRPDGVLGRSALSRPERQRVEQLRTQQRGPPRSRRLPRQSVHRSTASPPWRFRSKGRWPRQTSKWETRLRVCGDAQAERGGGLTPCRSEVPAATRNPTMQVVGAPTACAPEPWATAASPASAAARVAALGAWRHGCAAPMRDVFLQEVGFTAERARCPRLSDHSHFPKRAFAFLTGRLRGLELA